MATMADLAYPDATNGAPRDNAEAIRRVREAFQQHLGRDAGSDQSVIDDHLRGDVYRTGGIDAVLGAIQTSPEARAYYARPQSGGTPPGSTPPSGTPGTYGTTPYTDRGSGRGSSDWTERGLYAGFDQNQDPNNRLIGKSAKYTLLDGTRIAQEAGATDSWKTKEGAADFANQHLKKYLEDNGFEVLDIVGDKMKVRDHADRAAGREGSWVDWVVNAGDPANAKIGFQVEPTQEAFGTPETYRPQGFTPTSGGPAGTPAPTPNTPSDPYAGSPEMANEAYRALAGRSGTIENAVEAVRQAYRDALGREAGDYAQIVREHFGGGRNFAPNNVWAAVNGIFQSPEAQRRRASQPPPSTSNPPASPPPMSNLAYPELP